jgi:hypothetical protein
MASGNIFSKLYKLLKQHWESCPIAIALVASWSILPNTARLLAIAFAVLIILYDLIKWRYKTWADSEEFSGSKSLLNKCHRGLLASLFLLPLLIIAAYQVQKGVPKMLDGIVIGATADGGITNKVSYFYFGTANPHPTNFGIAYLGITKTNGATLFESTPFFSYATAGAITSLMMFSSVFLLVSIVAMFLFGAFELIVDFLHKRTVRPPPSKSP